VLGYTLGDFVHELMWSTCLPLSSLRQKVDFIACVKGWIIKHGKEVVIALYLRPAIVGPFKTNALPILFEDIFFYLGVCVVQCCQMVYFQTKNANLGKFWSIGVSCNERCW
jgi:hypothetical protein